MKTFQLLRKNMSVVGFQPPEPGQKFSVNWKTCVFFAVLVKYFILLILGFVFEASSFSEYALSVFTTTAAFIMIFILSVLVIKTEKISELINNFDIMIEKRIENPASKKMYELVNENIEKCTHIFYFLLFKVTLPGVMVPPLVISYFNYFTTDLGREAFKLPNPEWIPFDEKTPVGYFTAFTVQYIKVYCILHVVACKLSFFIGSSWLFMTFAKEIKREWNATKGLSELDQVEFKKRVHEYIEFHSTVKQLMFDFSDIFEYIVTAFFLWSFLSTCGSLLMVQMELEHTGFSIELIKPLIVAIWSFFAIFLYCELGERVSSQFEEINDAIYQSEWYAFPIEVQRMLPMILMATQKQVVPRGFGNLLCTRESLKKVVNGGFSYFMVLREFGH